MLWKKTSPHYDCVRTMIEWRSSLIRPTAVAAKFNSSFYCPILYSSAHRAPHIMALNIVTQMRIVYIFSLTMMDG